MSKKRKLNSESDTNSSIGKILSQLNIHDPNVLLEALSFSRNIDNKLPGVITTGNIKDAICIILASEKLSNLISIGEIQKVCHVNEKAFKHQHLQCISGLQLGLKPRGATCMIDKLSVHFNINGIKPACNQLLQDYQFNIVDRLHESARNRVNVDDDVYHAVAFWIVLQERKVITRNKSICEFIIHMYIYIYTNITVITVITVILSFYVCTM